uniref:Uncharacterized protein n=1 Tax=Anguilla anguilla TaxID=7936 RepID=A0A0E9XXS0_ANGAN
MPSENLCESDVKLVKVFVLKKEQSRDVVLGKLLLFLMCLSMPGC